MHASAVELVLLNVLLAALKKETDNTLSMKILVSSVEIVQTFAQLVHQHKNNKVLKEGSPFRTSFFVDFFDFGGRKNIGKYERDK